MQRHLRLGDIGGLQESAYAKLFHGVSKRTFVLEISSCNWLVLMYTHCGHLYFLLIVDDLIIEGTECFFRLFQSVIRCRSCARYTWRSLELPKEFKVLKKAAAWYLCGDCRMEDLPGELACHGSSGSSLVRRGANMTEWRPQRIRHMIFSC